ncbi:MAG: hypothetical protein ABJK28_02055 [Algibacter sp.]
MRIFKEEQRFTQPWLIILMIITALFAIVVITTAFRKTDNTNVFGYIIPIGLILLSTGIIFIFKLKTRIDRTGIHYQFFPFHFKMKTILWDEIKHAETRTYNPLTEYGGWGLKSGGFWGKKRGTAINVKGNIGIQLILNTNKKVLIGTQKQADANSVIAKYLEQKDNG